MNEENDPNEPKLIIDNDWKAQVQKEKEELAKQDAETSEDAAEAPVAGQAGGSEDSANFPPPPASFEMLVTMLASQALVSMGQVPNPMTGKPEPNKAYARHYIDTIAMLQEKAEGNMSEQEEQIVSQTLHQLRLLFVSM